eukprot:jgi/Mesvir1/2618/Mv05577-RA.1
MSYAADAIASLQKFATPKDFVSDLWFALSTNLFTCLLLTVFPAIAKIAKTKVKAADREYTFKQFKIAFAPLATGIILAVVDGYLKTGKILPGSKMAWLNLILFVMMLYASWWIAVMV